ncbi:8-amino-7-oxononanoate synthase [Alcaligenes faecalis]|uniref:aminotransferase class I/II-fold pyridoxal phosphate-dependent enzyme n=1 Tax=Alcaligenes faecalis TaxID=511 RepID=UPI001C82DD8A|nr:8-amino-7-oxononanoate synthase [Alcaligenes faecalis]MBX6965461.1 8-amino-7-oxononanoate synthase [Providencia rettgeri]MBX7030836.1 8-amino-7-oxononanoate synthase [Alcaligenes faecalis]
MSAFLTHLDQQLEALKTRNLWRQRAISHPLPNAHIERNGQVLLNFASNDYLGLSQHPQFKLLKAQDVAGATASPLICGHHTLAQQLELELADWSGFEACRLFVSGYQASLGVIPALVGTGDTIFCDRLNHASLIDASRLSGARLRVYPHRDMARLDDLLSRPTTGFKLVISDSLFSMDGTVAPVDELIELCERHDALLYLDDAHGLGVLGENGRGAPEHFLLNTAQRQRLIYLGTFGKAAGQGGAFIACSHSLADWFTQSARSYVYSTGLAPAHCASLLACLQLIKQAQPQRASLKEHIQTLQTLNQDLPWRLAPSDTPVQSLLMGEVKPALLLSEILLQKGIWAPAIRPPTVPRHQARLRISLSAAHRRQDIEKLVQALHEAAHSLR